MSGSALAHHNIIHNKDKKNKVVLKNVSNHEIKHPQLNVTEKMKDFHGYKKGSGERKTYKKTYDV